MIAESISKNRIIVHLDVWTRQAIEFYSIKSCQKIEQSAEMPHIEHIARNAANHLIPTTYGLQYNCGKFKLEYVSDSLSFKFQQDS